MLTILHRHSNKMHCKLYNTQQIHFSGFTVYCVCAPN